MKSLRWIATLVIALAVAAGLSAVPPGPHQPVKAKKPIVIAPRKHKYSAKQAAAIALKKYPGKLVGKVKIENEEGKWEYAVNIRQGKKLLEVMVGADSGKIVSVEKTTAAKEKAEEGKPDRKGTSKAK